MEGCKKKSIKKDKRNKQKQKQKQIGTKKMYFGCDSCKRDNVKL